MLFCSITLSFENVSVGHLTLLHAVDIKPIATIAIMIFIFFIKFNILTNVSTVLILNYNKLITDAFALSTYY